MRRHSRGVTDLRLRLYWDDFKNLRVALPPKKEATAIYAKIADLAAGRVFKESPEAHLARLEALGS